MKNFIHMFNNVNKSYILQHNLKKDKKNLYNLSDTKLLTFNT